MSVCLNMVCDTFCSRDRRRKWQPTPVFLPGESQGLGASWATIYGVAQSPTRLKRLSSSSRDKQKFYGPQSLN